VNNLWFVPYIYMSKIFEKWEKLFYIEIVFSLNWKFAR